MKKHQLELKKLQKEKERLEYVIKCKKSQKKKGDNMNFIDLFSQKKDISEHEEQKE
jgi:hypothetical protein